MVVESKNGGFESNPMRFEAVKKFTQQKHIQVAYMIIYIPCITG